MNIVEATEVADLVAEVSRLEDILSQLRDDDKEDKYNPEDHYGVLAKDLSVSIKVELKLAKQQIAQFKVGKDD